MAVAQPPNILPGHWRVSIAERDHPSRRVIGWLSDKVPTPSGGGGGWEKVTLPGHRPVLVWRNGDLLQLQLGIILGAVADTPAKGAVGGDPVVSDRQRLVNMYRPNDPEETPPIVRIDSRGDAVPFQQFDYAISELAWGDAEADGDMNRIMQGFDLTLTEYRPDVRIGGGKAGPPSKHRQSGQLSKAKLSGRGARYHRARKGETLGSISKAYGLSNWRDLGLAQNPTIYDPRGVREGQQIRLPNGSEPDLAPVLPDSVGDDLFGSS